MGIPAVQSKLLPSFRRRNPLALLLVAFISIAYLFFSLGHLHFNLPCEPSSFFRQIDTDLQKHTVYPQEFPKYIWQTSSVEQRQKWAEKIETWTANNPDWQYTWLDDEAQDTFVAENFQDNPSILAFWRNLKSIILRADLIRYLAILSQGGIYTDIDTSNTAPIHEWIPEDMRDREINAVVGIEYDDDTYKMFVRRIEFCQWTLMAKPGHPIIKAVVQRVMDHLEYIARIKHTTLDQITLNKAEVLEATGPGAYSDAVLQVLRDQVGEYLEFESFSGMKEPTLYGDVLVLPINGFGFGQKHSHSGDPSYGRALARHHFGRSWYKTKPDTSQGKAKTQKKKNDPETKA